MQLVSEKQKSFHGRPRFPISFPSHPVHRHLIIIYLGKEMSSLEMRTCLCPELRRLACLWHMGTTHLSGAQLSALHAQHILRDSGQKTVFLSKKSWLYELAPNHFSGFKEEERILVAPWLYDGSLLAFVSSCDDLTQLGPLQSVQTPYTNS